jgi:hypothetical protein
VFRLNNPLTEEKLEQVNSEFSDILAEGRFIQGNALSGERDEPELADRPRLIFRFNRQDLGRLRQLINVINDTPQQ